MPPLEIAIGRGRANLAALKLIGVHRQAHRAAGTAPFKPGGDENLVEALGLGGFAYCLRARHDQRCHRFRHMAALGDARGFAQIGQTAVGARADKGHVDLRAGDRHAACEAHEFQRLDHRRAIVGRDIVRSRQPLAHSDGLAGVDSPRHRRLNLRGIDPHHVVVHGIGIRRERRPPLTRARERVAPGHERAAFHVPEGRLVRVHIPHARGAFNRHIAHGHALFHRHPIEDVAAVFIGVPGAAFDAEPLNDVQNDVFRVHAGPERSVHGNAAHLQRLDGEALRCQHVAHLRGADAEGDGAERAVRRGVAVAARDGDAGLREPELGSNDVHDALVDAVEAIERNAELAAVALERRHHCFGKHVEKRAALIERGHDVVHRRKRAVRVGHRAAAHPQHIEGLRAGDFVNQMQPDEQLRLPRRQLAHRVPVPDLVKKCVSHRVKYSNG